MPAPHRFRPSRCAGAVRCAQFHSRSGRLAFAGRPSHYRIDAIRSGFLSLTDTAFFFDFDGTLVELAPTPDSIHVPPSLLTLLDELRRRSHGAVAIVSGRGIDNIDTFLKMPGMPIAGLHGAERRDANGDTQRIGFNDERLLRIERELAAVVDRHPGMLLEIKGAAVALHYRNAPEREAAARGHRAPRRRLCRCVCAAARQDGVRDQAQRRRQGRALAAFLDEPPFAGACPCSQATT